MSLILVFDLDDTLYPEHTYVQSGIKSVASFLSKHFFLVNEKTEKRLLEILKTNGRGKVFDIFLQENGIFSKKNLKKCVDTYRHHCPKIYLYPGCLQIISSFEEKKYLVTDGHKVVQKAKVKALRIESIFEKIYLTNLYGKVNAKPSLHCFRKILERENSHWTSLVYIGDNPAKDFVNLNLMGAITVRVLTGRHKFDSCQTGYDAKFIINNLSELSLVLKDFHE